MRSGHKFATILTCPPPASAIHISTLTLIPHLAAGASSRAIARRLISMRYVLAQLIAAATSLRECGMALCVMRGFRQSRALTRRMAR